MTSLMFFLPKYLHVKKEGHLGRAGARGIVKKGGSSRAYSSQGPSFLTEENDFPLSMRRRKQRKQ